MSWSTASIPVAPYVLPDLAVPSLMGLAPRTQVRITGKVPERLPPDIPYFKPEHSYLSISAALELGFSGIVSIASAADATLMLRESRLVLAVVERSDESLEQTIINREFYGISLRIAMNAWNFKASVNANMDTLVAQGTLNIAQSAMQFQCVGCGYPLMQSVSSLLGASSNAVTTASYQSMVLMEQAFWDYILDNYYRIRPVLLGVELKPTFFTRVNTREPSVNYALFGIMKGRRCQEILRPNGAYYPKNLDVDNTVIQAVYSSIVGPDLNALPTADNKRAAKKASFDFDDSK